MKRQILTAFILKDLYSYRNIIEKLYSRSNSLSVYYPNKIKELFEIVVSANCISKSQQFRKYFASFFKDRNLMELFKDMGAAFKCAVDIFFGK